MLRITRALCMLQPARIAAAATSAGWRPLNAAAACTAPVLHSRALPVLRFSPSSLSSAVGPYRSFASRGGDDDDDGGGDDSSGGGGGGGGSIADEGAEREKPAAGAVVGRASKADRAALKAKQKRASKAAAEETKHARARQEKERVKMMRAAAQRSLSDALGDGAPNAEAEAAARQQARELGIEAAKDELGLSPEQLVKAKTVSRQAAEAVAAAAASVAAAAAAASSKSSKAAKEDTPLNRAIKAAAALTAGGKRVSPAAMAAATAEVNRLKALAAAEASIVRLNEKITANQLIVLGFPDGKKLPGIFTRSQALAKAKEAGLDLLQISPPHAPPPAVVKILDYNRHMSEVARREKESKRALKNQAPKENKTIQLKSKIAPGDLRVKIEQMRKFLQGNHPVKLIYISKNPDPAIFFPLLQTCVDALILDGSLPDESALSSTKHWVNFSPISAKKRQQIYPRLTEEQRKKFGVEQGINGIWIEKGRRMEIKEGEEQEEKEEEKKEEGTEKHTQNTTPVSSDVAAPAVTATPAAAAARPVAASPPAPAASASVAASKEAAQREEEDENEEEEEEDEEEEEEEAEQKSPQQKQKGGKGNQKAAAANAASSSGGGKKHSKQKTSYIVSTPLFSQQALRAKLAQQQQQSGGGKK